MNIFWSHSCKQRIGSHISGSIILLVFSLFVIRRRSSIHIMVGNATKYCYYDAALVTEELLNMFSSYAGHRYHITTRRRVNIIIAICPHLDTNLNFHSQLRTCFIQFSFNEHDSIFGIFLDKFSSNRYNQFSNDMGVNMTPFLP